MKDVTKVWEQKTAQQLVEALLSISDIPTMESFLRDVLTEKEIVEASSRLEAARMLKDGARYSEVTNTTKLSSRTVARISDWLQNGCGGYVSVMKQVDGHWHISPVRAE